MHSLLHLMPCEVLKIIFFNSPHTSNQGYVGVMQYLVIPGSQ